MVRPVVVSTEKPEGYSVVCYISDSASGTVGVEFYFDGPFEFDVVVKVSYDSWS